jgi:hypothetical protein
MDKETREQKYNRRISEAIDGVFILNFKID